MHNQAYQGIVQDYLAFASRQGWGANFNYLDFGGVPKTTISNPDGVGLERAGLNDLALSAGYGRVVFEALSAGAAFKFIQESIADVSAQGYAVDFGLLYDVERFKGLSLGGAVQNAGPAMRFQKSSENLPLTIRGGAAYQAPLRGQKCAFALDIIKERGESAAVAFGAEVLAARRFPIRIGYSSRNDSGIGLAFGAGYRHESFDIDYAFAPYGALGDAHRISATLRWGKTILPRAKD